MITVGGINGTKTDNCDWEWMGVAILDLTSMAWGSVFDSSKASYQVSPLVSAVIGGGLDGGASKLLPDGGWTSIPVANLFTGTSSQTAPYTPPNANSSDDGNSGSSGSNVGAIVGGAVGGGVGLLLILGTLGLWWNRRKNQRKWRDGATELAGPSEHKDEIPQGTDPITPLSPVSELGGSTMISELPENQIPVELGDRSNYDRNSWRPGEGEEITLNVR